MVLSDTIPWRNVLRMHRPMLLSVLGIAVGLSLVDRLLSLELPFTPVPFQIVGVAIAFFLGFRNNAAYDRWWEGRKIWGGIVNASRAFARQALTLIDAPPEVHRTLVLRHVAWVEALRCQLRDQPALDAVRGYLSAEDQAALAGQKNVASALVHLQGAHVAALAREGRLSEERLVAVDRTLTELHALQGMCERIKSTPLPTAYRFFTRQFVRGYCLTLPVGLVENHGLVTVVVVLLVALVFLIAETIGRLLEEPFTTVSVYGLPLQTIARNIEIDLRQRLGDTDLPPPIAPERRADLDVLL
jgi:putative membrane protein